MFFPSGQHEDRISCDCGRVAERTWLKAPGVTKEMDGGFNVQLGCYVKNRQHLERIAKERGKVLLGPDELRRTDSQSHGERVDHEAENLKLREAMKKAWSDVRNGNVPKTEVPTTPSDAIIATNNGGSAPPIVS